MKNVSRGYGKDDAVLFSKEKQQMLSDCAKDVVYLLDRGYPYRSAITFVGNHFLLTQRQRNALMRICCSEEMKQKRKEKQLDQLEEGCTVHVDAFNAIVLMETALSGSMVLKGMDGCYRDLSGLAGTYSVIERTVPAIECILCKLKEHHVAKAVFWIDEPVSNSGRLKTCIAESAEKLGFPVDLRMVRNADRELIHLDHVISGDSVIIAECISWYNLYAEMITELEQAWIVDLCQFGF